MQRRAGFIGCEGARRDSDVAIDCNQISSTMSGGKLLNCLHYVFEETETPLAELPDDFDNQLVEIGYCQKRGSLL